jgi:hypothetical protein
VTRASGEHEGMRLAADARSWPVGGAGQARRARGEHLAVRHYQENGRERDDLSVMLAKAQVVSYGQLMSSTIISGLFALIGTTLGVALSEVSRGWRSSVEQRRVKQIEATARVFDAARIAVAFCEGSRWLIEVDVMLRKHGQGIGRESYEAKAVELAEQLQQLRLIPLAVAAKGPRSALPQIETLVMQTQEFSTKFSATSRQDTADREAELLNDCDQIAKIAKDLVSQL